MEGDACFSGGGDVCLGFFLSKTRTRETENTFYTYWTIIFSAVEVGN